MNTMDHLTEEEKEKAYSKYYYRAHAVPSIEKIALLKQPIESRQALPIERLNDLLHPGYREVETGWCVLPCGGAYVANHTFMPDVTIDMVNWWFAWHSLESLRYKIWWPQGHYSISIGAKDRKKVLNPSTPPTQRFQGITHHVVEDTGNGLEDIFINFLTPENAGFAVERCRPPYVGTIIAANGLSSVINAPNNTPKSPAFMLHFVREIPGGVEFRSRFWMGYHMIEKQPKLLLPSHIKVPAFVPQGLAMHNVSEYTNLASFLPQLFHEQQGRME